jgi:hypothetical protein
MGPYAQVLWTWIIRIFITLGGFAGVTKILEWLFSGPKIIGEIEQTVFATVSENGSVIGAHIMLQVYLVNKRIRPTTVRGWRLTVEIESKHYATEIWSIPENFVLSDKDGKPYPIDFAKSRLYDIAGMNLLEYGKGIRGWLRFVIRDASVSGPDLKSGATLKLVVIDALGRTHAIRHTTGRGSPKPGYYPGAGIKTN